jgi:hypothetical protein
MFKVCVLLAFALSTTFVQTTIISETFFSEQNYVEEEIKSIEKTVTDVQQNFIIEVKKGRLLPGKFNKNCGVPKIFLH